MVALVTPKKCRFEIGVGRPLETNYAMACFSKMGVYVEYVELYIHGNRPVL